MKNRFIIFKLFIITGVFLSLFIGLILFFQTKYFATYYKNLKITELNSKVEIAQKSLDQIVATDEVLLGKLQDIQGKYGYYLFLCPVKKVNFDSMNPKDLYGNCFYLKGNNEINDFLYKQSLLYISKGVITKKPIIESFQLNENGANYLTSIQSITINKSPYLLVVATSMQPVDQAMTTLNEISWIAYNVAILFSLVLSVVIAKLIARPLIKEIEREKELDVLRKDFIANASHEMKTPISIISGYSESLIDGILTDDERKEYEQVIFDETQKMGKLVRDMLEIAMLQNEKFVLHKTNCDLNQLLSKTLYRLDKLVKDKNLKMDEKSVEQVSTAADPDMMEIVFVNLITNAISHTPTNGYISIRLYTKNKRICFEIENEGKQVPNDSLSHLWESFYRVDKAHNREEGRFGLGLFTVKTIIEKHNGMVGCANTDKGVMFYFEIPNQVN